MLSITFYGVRGSTPCSCDDTRAFGGNTTCLAVRAGDEPPLICDLGTGARYLGLELMADRSRRLAADPFQATALLTHLHWDHIQGLPFFTPILDPGAVLDVYGPPQPGSTLSAELAGSICPPMFPVAVDALPGTLNCREVAAESFPIGSATVTSFPVAHVGPTNGYRIDAGAGSVALISDHQEPMGGAEAVAQELVDACTGVDLFIHDAQYDASELARKPDWGHCTGEFALELALRCQARRLVLFHHDPTHDDDWVQAQLQRVRAQAGDRLEVLAAAEGSTLTSG